MKIVQFLQEVAVHIRSKEARQHVTEELNGHLQDAKAAYMRGGDEEATAEAKAVESMGSSMQLGRQMNKLHKPKTDWLLVGLFVAALGLGFLPIWIENTLYERDLEHLYWIKGLHIAVCIAVVIGLYFLDYRKLWYGRGIMKMAVLVSVVLFGQFATINTRGDYVLQLGSFELTEQIFIPFFIVAWGILLANNKRPLYVFAYYFLATLGMVFVWLSSEMVMLYIVISLSQFVISYYTKREKWVMIGGFVLLIIAFFVEFGSRFESLKLRVLAFLHPEDYADTAGYMKLLIEDVRQAAGWSGSAEIVELPASYTNFALVSVLQGVGYAGVLLVVVVLFSLLAKLLWNSWIVEQRFGKQLVVGTVMYYGYVLLQIVGMLFGFLPVNGLGVPFVSYGFTDLLVFAILIGFVLSVYRRKSLTEYVKVTMKPGKQQGDFVDDLIALVKEDLFVRDKRGSDKKEEPVKLDANASKWQRFFYKFFEGER